MVENKTNKDGDFIVDKIVRMVYFKKNVNKELPYDRGQYIDFLAAADKSTLGWNGISFQLVAGGKKINFAEFVENYEPLLKNVILEIDNGSFWVINHDDKDLQWFPNDDDNLVCLRTLFKNGSIPNAFKGALVCMKNDLLECAKDIISYPYALLNRAGLLYKDLDISHSEIKFIIKISGHLNVDFLSTDKELLRKIVNENTSKAFNVKQYRGTSL